MLLSDNKFIDFISASIDEFIAINQNETDPISRSLLWESLKVHLRGQIISYSAHLNKILKAKIRALSIDINKLDEQLATCSSPNLLKRRVELQIEFDLITTADAERLLLRSHSSYYEHGDKASRLLAHQLRRQAASRFIPQTQDSSGRLHTNPSTINAVFSSFYSSLYESESPSDTTDMNYFLDSLDFPVINPEVAKQLDSLLTVEEIMLAMKRQGKANLFVEHNSYTRQFKVLYSYIKSEEGKKKIIP